MTGRRSRGGGRARLRLWIAIGGAAATALVFAASASAASASVTNCTEVPGAGFAITFSGSGFAANSIVTARDNGVLRGTTATDSKGSFSNFTILVTSLPSEVTFADAAGNTASLTVTSCGGDDGGGGGGDAPTTKDDCKKGGYEDFTEPSFKNQGQCVSSVASKNK